MVGLVRFLGLLEASKFLIFCVCDKMQLNYFVAMDSGLASQK